MRTLFCFICCVSAGALLASTAANAATYDKAACETFRTEHASLIAAGLKADMDKGVEWGRANLSEDRLKQIARLIEVEEVLAFRCRTLQIPIRRRETVPVLDANAIDDGDLVQEKPSAKPVAKPAKKGTEPEKAAETTVPQEKAAAKPPATTGSTELQKASAAKTKPKTAATKRKPAPVAPKPEPPGLFDLNLE